MEKTQYVITFVDRTGIIKKRQVSGSSEADARKASGISAGQILSVKQDWLSMLMLKLNEDRPSLALQAEIIASFAPQANSGLNVTKVFDDLLSQYPIFEKKMGDVKRTTRITEKMLLVGFNSELQLLATIGETTGLIGEVLGGAADEMIKRQKVIANFRKSVVPPLASAFLGIVIMLVMPIWVAPEVVKVMHSRGVKMDVNFATNYLLFLGDFMPKYWWTLVLALIGIAWTAPKWFEVVKGYPVFKSINEYFQLSRSYRFITGFVPLFSRGVQLRESFSLMARHAGRSERETYESMLKDIDNGSSMGSVFKSDYWHRVLRQMMTSSDAATDANKRKLMESAQGILENQMERISDRIATALQTFGTAMTIGVIILIFYGMTLPLLTVRAA